MVTPDEQPNILVYCAPAYVAIHRRLYTFEHGPYVCPPYIYWNSRRMSIPYKMLLSFSGSQTQAYVRWGQAMVNNNKTLIS